jgi:hypothetical protein
MMTLGDGDPLPKTQVKVVRGYPPFASRGLPGKGGRGFYGEKPESCIAAGGPCVSYAYAQARLTQAFPLACFRQLVCDYAAQTHR